MAMGMVREKEKGEEEGALMTAGGHWRQVKGKARGLATPLVLEAACACLHDKAAEPCETSFSHSIAIWLQ